MSTDPVRVILSSDVLLSLSEYRLKEKKLQLSLSELPLFGRPMLTPDVCTTAGYKMLDVIEFITGFHNNNKLAHTMR